MYYPLKSDHFNLKHHEPYNKEWLLLRSLLRSVLHSVSQFCAMCSLVLLVRLNQERMSGMQGKKLYVGGLSYNSTEEGLADLFSKSGAVDSVKIITDRDTGRSKGFAFVEMASIEEASTAITDLNGKEFDGRRLLVNEARPQAPRENRSRW